MGTLRTTLLTTQSHNPNYRNRLGTFDLNLSSRLTTKVIDKLTVEWYLGNGASGASCIASNNASWTFDPRTLVSGEVHSSRWAFSDNFRHWHADIEVGNEVRPTVIELQPSRQLYLNVIMSLATYPLSHVYTFCQISISQAI